MRILIFSLTAATGLLLSPALLANEAAPVITKEQETAMVNDIHKKVAATSKESSEADMKSYTNTIPGTAIAYSLLPIKGGEFLMGSPEAEANRKPDEGPQHKVKVEPFWMGEFEVTWNEYELFMYPDQSKAAKDAPKDTSDALAHPTKPYVEMSFGMGKDKFPAISMTQHAANKYCQWLSAKTGHFYRLPTEAEWEYACRAGTTTAYSFGDDEAKLGDYAWFVDNSTGSTGDVQYHKIGTKKPNPWGLYDMHGNVAEWCLDQFDPNYYKQFKDTTANPWNKATKPYPHVARGGGFDADPDALRSAARVGSHKDWKQQDPQLPKSIWYLTDAKFLGFRLIRPLKVPSAEEMFKYWNNGVENE